MDSKTKTLECSICILRQCLRMGMMLTLGVNGTGINQCGPLQESTLTLGVVRVKASPSPFLPSATVVAER